MAMEGRIDVPHAGGKDCTMPETLSLSEIEALAHDCLTRAGVSAAVADAVAAEVAAAEGEGDRANGLQSLLCDLKSLRYGQVVPDAEPVVTTPRPGLMRVDAGHGFAAPALLQALPDLIDMACAQGVACLQLTGASPAGAMAVPRNRIGAAGLAARSLTQAAPGAFAPPCDDPFAGQADQLAVLLVAEAAVLPHATPKARQHMVEVPADLLAQIVGA